MSGLGKADIVLLDNFVGASEHRGAPVDHQNMRTDGTGRGAVTRFALVRQLVKTHLGSGFVPSSQPKIRY
jgi:hypothetical protein